MKYQNLSKLLNQVSQDVQAQKYFKATISHGEVKVESVQSGVCRVNCMDCLDRTNVVQSVITYNRTNL